MVEKPMSLQDQREYQLVENLKKQYQESILMSLRLAEMIADRETLLGESTSPDPKPYPPCSFDSFELLGEPVYQFRYEGMLPLYSDDRLSQKKLRNYYQTATMEAIHEWVRSEGLRAFDQAFLYICYFFSNLRVRDLDNQNRRHLINAMRRTRLIQDDNWKRISNMEKGFFDPSQENYILLYVTHEKNKLRLIEYVDQMMEKRV